MGRGSGCARSYQSELEPQISADELLVAETVVVRSVQCKYCVWLFVCLLAGKKLSTNDCLLKLESNAGGEFWSSQNLSSRTRNCNQRSSSGKKLAKRYDRFGDEIHESWDVYVRLGAVKRLLGIGIVTSAAACLVSVVYCWLNRELSL